MFQFPLECFYRVTPNEKSSPICTLIYLETIATPPLNLSLKT
jgi:hypothetical protein